MIVGRVTGNVVSSNKSEKLRNAKLLIVQIVDIGTMEMKDDYLIMIDDVGAGVGDLVFGAYGSSSRQSDTSKHAPMIKQRRKIRATGKSDRKRGIHAKMRPA